MGKDMRKFQDMTKSGKGFVEYLLNERLKFWKESGYCSFEVGDKAIEISSKDTLHGGIVIDVMKVVEVWGLTSYIYKDEVSIRIRIY